MGLGYLFQLEATEKKISSGEEHQDDEQPSAIPKHTKTRPARINFMSLTLSQSRQSCMHVGKDVEGVVVAQHKHCTNMIMIDVDDR
jgi:hypothetical protein